MSRGERKKNKKNKKRGGTRTRMREREKKEGPLMGGTIKQTPTAITRAIGNYTWTTKGVYISVKSN